MDNHDTLEQILASLRDIIQENNEESEIDLNDLNESTQLIGKNAILDSLTLVSLIVDVEQKINDQYNLTITVADERAMSQEKSPFRTIGTLADYVNMLVKEQS